MNVVADEPGAAIGKNKMDSAEMAAPEVLRIRTRIRRVACTSDDALDRKLSRTNDSRPCGRKPAERPSPIMIAWDEPSTAATINSASVNPRLRSFRATYSMILSPHVEMRAKQSFAVRVADATTVLPSFPAEPGFADRVRSGFIPRGLADAGSGTSTAARSSNGRSDARTTISPAAGELRSGSIF